MSRHPTELEPLTKTTRMNLLFDWYEPLLTERQRTYMRYYFHDDYSLGEIAAEFDVSRQAVYDQLKRTEMLLEQYESKLGLLARHERRQRMIRELRAASGQLPEEQRDVFERLLDELEELDRG
jgi:hypothetical protein